MLTLAGITKTYPSGLLALDHVDLTIEAGSFTSIVGPSGCGKSTLLRMIAGLDEPTSGTIAGRPEDVGLVFQDATLMPWADVEANVHLPLRLTGVKRKDAAPRIAEALALVGLSEFAHAYPRALSGGMKMRVAIARALVTRPRLLLMDEPFAALDEITRNRLNDDLLRLWRDQKFTTVFITHSVFESVYLSTDIAVMTPRPGRVMALHKIGGPPARDAGFRADPAYLDGCRAVSHDLEQALRAPA
ncbi:MAG TPA: ABC transporter ATP-binding protein [Alphaproteobacteria bacterium]|jgi:NitT/TauT family transport system ATP-binding protein|nr:ABC transporter ATP-binding protein [Alphaproteobacteria bacterium]